MLSLPPRVPRPRPHATPWTARVFQLLEDSPRLLEYVLAEAGSLVPPGIAWREIEISRRYSSNRGGRTSATREFTDDLVRKGQRRVVSHSLWTSIKSGRLVRFEQDDQKWIRIGRAPEEGFPRTLTQRETAQMNIQKARAVQLTPEQRHLRALKSAASMTPEQRSERGKKAALAWTREERSARMKLSAAAMAPELRRERALKSAATRRLKRAQQE